MPTNQPNNAPIAAEPVELDETAQNAVIADEQLDDAPGGGGLGGAAAADPLAGTAGGQGGAAPNAPIDTGLATDGDPTREAQARSAETTPSTGGRSSGS